MIVTVIVVVCVFGFRLWNTQFLYNLLFVCRIEIKQKKHNNAKKISLSCILTCFHNFFCSLTLIAIKNLITFLQLDNLNNCCWKITINYLIMQFLSIHKWTKYAWKIVLKGTFSTWTNWNIIFNNRKIVLFPKTQHTAEHVLFLLVTIH